MLKSIPHLALLSVLVSCGMQGPESIKKLDLVNSHIISIRSQNEEIGSFMVRLKTPGLIESATINGKDINISESHKLEVIKEQDDFLRAARQLSPDIQVLYSTKLVMNSVTIIAPPSVMKTINNLPMVMNAREVSLFSAPDLATQSELGAALKKSIQSLQERNSVSFIGGLEARKKYNLTGKNLRIGIIDTGIDYTHTMFGGSGSVDEFKSIDGNAENGLFPTAKIEGGIDLVGDLYSPGSPYAEHKLPKPDKNPIDYNGHGTHVAGTVAGLGDNINTYDGVAPDAKLHAIKVFGKNSTSDAVVIAALEYSLDPDGDLDPKDRLDIVNLSLGGSYGKPSINYAEAVKNVVRAGVSFVAAAGNSGNNPYIVGAPSTATDALSVAAGIDDMLHNYQMEGSEISLNGVNTVIISPYASFSKKIAEDEVVSAAAVFIGLASGELSDEMKTEVKGKIAIIDRGGNPFTEKATNALNAGAIGVVIVQNTDDEPSNAGGSSDPMTIPVVMISKKDGQLIKDALKKGEETIFTFSKKAKFEKPELIDTITGFSSRGPRSEDGLIKPEIVAPGQQIIAAATGKGNGGAALNGTSMAAPHIAGVMALMQERYPTLSVLDHKHLLMSTSKIISDAQGIRYPVTAQGAGRVDIMKALEARILPSTGGFSLGKINLLKNSSKKEKLTLTNLTDEDINFTLKEEFTAGLSLAEKGESYILKARGSLTLDLNFALNKISASRTNYQGFLKLIDTLGHQELAHFPVLAVVHEASAIAHKGIILSKDKIGLLLKNESSMKGVVYPFNLIAVDGRKPDPGALSQIRSRACDLKSSGYRLLKRKIGEEEKVFLQVAVKLYESVSDWQACDISVQIDSNGDNNVDLEWVATRGTKLPGLSKSAPDGFYSLLLDAQKARDLRVKFENTQRDSRGESKDEEDYRQAVKSIQPYVPFNQSSVNMMEIDLSALGVVNQDAFKVKVATLHENWAAIKPDDYLVSEDSWHKINLSSDSVLPEVLELDGYEVKSVMIPRSQDAKKVVLYSPSNADGRNGESKDLQEIILDL